MAQLMTFTVLPNVFLEVVPANDGCPAMYTYAGYHTMLLEVVDTTPFPDALPLLLRCHYVLFAIAGHSYQVIYK
jgi:hypothetical protein